MILRQWCGLAKAECADEYIEHLRREMFPQLSRIDGFLSASILKRHLEVGVEFLVVTHWDSTEAIARFAGENIDSAVVPPNVERMMIDYDRTVRHY